MDSLLTKSSAKSQKNSRNWAAIVLAAGAGKRMKFKLPKLLCPVAGRPMVLRVLDSLNQIAISQIIVVVGHEAELMRSEIIAKNTNSQPIIFATQKCQLGTGDAVLAGLSAIKEQSPVTDLIILNGDMPLLQTKTIIDLLAGHTANPVAGSLLTVHLDDPSGYGRILRKADGRITKIIEESDANTEQKKIKEVNAGIYCFQIESLREALSELQPLNAQSEFYLTDVAYLLTRRGQKISTIMADDPLEVMGVNDIAQLKDCAKIAGRYIN